MRMFKSSDLCLKLTLSVNYFFKKQLKIIATDIDLAPKLINFSIKINILCNKINIFFNENYVKVENKFKNNYKSNIVLNVFFKLLIFEKIKKISSLTMFV